MIMMKGAAHLPLRAASKNGEAKTRISLCALFKSGICFSKSKAVAIPTGTLVNAYQNVVASTTILTVPGHLPSFVNVESTSIGIASPPSSRPELG